MRVAVLLVVVATEGALSGVHIPISSHAAAMYNALSKL